MLMRLPLLGALAGATLALIPACNRKAQDSGGEPPGASAAASAAGSAAPADTDTTEVAPPPAVAAADPSVPLNEAFVGTPSLPADYAGVGAPPALIEEDQPARPDTNDVWVPGYWWWSVPLHKYVWVGGAWREPPPGQVWNPGQWMLLSGESYSWSPGWWGAPGASPLAFISLAPPAPRVEVMPASPGVGYVWTPGYYDYRVSAYEWVAGTWVRPPQEGVAWVEPCYVFSGGRYWFRPGRWDYPIWHRGVVYGPDFDVHPGVHYRPVPVTREVLVAHEGFVVASHLGGVRTPGGGYVVSRGRYVRQVGPANPPTGSTWHPGNEPREGSEAHGGGGNEPHGTPPPHGGPPPGHGGQQPPRHGH